MRAFRWRLDVVEEGLCAVVAEEEEEEQEGRVLRINNSSKHLLNNLRPGPRGARSSMRTSTHSSSLISSSL